MIKKRLVDVWDKIEKYAIFIALILFAIFQLLDSFINNAILDKILNLNTINMFIAVILLYLFLYIDRRLPLQSKYARGIKVFDHFDEAVLYALADIQSIRQIDIFAHSSDGYYSLLRHQLDNMRSLEKIRIIVRNPDSENFISHLKNPNAVHYERNQIRNRIESWMNLSKVEKWKNVKLINTPPEIELYEYDFDPPLNMLIVDKKILCFELRKPTQEGWGFISEKTFVVTTDDEIGLVLVHEYMDWFESTKNERTKLIRNV